MPDIEIFHRDPDYVWKTVSPSQLETAELCLRKWWFEKPARLVPIYDERQQWTFDYGTAAHSAIEDYLNGDPVPIQSDRYWKESVPFLDSIKDEVLATEIDFLLPLEGAKVPVYGIIDVLKVTGITDHKTVSDRKWALTKDQLKHKIQTRVYGLFFFHLFDPDAEFAEIQLNYVQKPPNPHSRNKRYAPANWQVQNLVSREDLLETEKNEIVPFINLMYETAQLETHIEVEATTTACGKYGGCPFRAICHQETATKRFANIQNRVSNREALMAKFDPAKFKKKIKGEDVPVDDSEDAKTRAQQKLAKLKAGGTGNEKSKDFRKSKETPKVPRETFEEKDPDKEDYRERADRERLEALEALIKDFEGMLEHYANNTLMERGILDENMEIDGEEGLFNAACFLFEMNEIETTPPALPQAVKIKFAQWRRAVQISPDDARENHEAGADIDDSTGDEITDLQKAADTPNNGLTPTMYEYVTSNWKFTHLADFARCTEEQLLEIKGIGSKSVRDLRKFLEERGIVIGSQAKFVDPDEEDDDEYVDDFEDEEDDGPVAAAPVAATPVEGGAVRPRSTYAADAGGFTISYKRKVNNPEDKYEYIELGIEGPGGPSASVALVNLRALRDEVNKMALDPDLFE